jgi:hypothetical protein
VNQPGLSDFKGSRNRFPFSTAGNNLDVDGPSLGDLQPIAFLLLEVAGDVKRETARVAVNKTGVKSISLLESVVIRRFILHPYPFHRT